MMKNFMAYQKIYAALQVTDTKITRYIVYLLSLMMMFVFSPINMFLIMMFISNIQSERYSKNKQVITLLPCSKKQDCYYYYATGLYSLWKCFIYAAAGALLIYFVLFLFHADVSKLLSSIFSYDSSLTIYRITGLFAVMIILHLCLAFLDRIYHESKMYVIIAMVVSFISMYFFFHHFENEIVYVFAIIIAGISIICIPWITYQIEKRGGIKHA